MRLAIFQLVIASFMLSGLHCSESLHACSEYATEYQISQDEKSFSFGQDMTSQFPITISFSDPVSSIESSSLRTKLLKSQQWLLELPASHDENSTNSTEHLSFRAFHNSSEVKILQIEAEGRSICDSLEIPISPCGIREKLNLTDKEVLLREAAWSSGRNFHIKLPSYPTFVGYIIDLFFTKPITGIDVEGHSDIKVVTFSSTHWAFVKNWTEPACIKLVDIFFTISYKNWSDVEAILFNGHYAYPINGQGKKSLAIFENKISPNAADRDCSSFFAFRGGTWFGEEIGNALWFKAQVQPRPQVGLVVDIIFEKEIMEFRTWKLRSEKIKGNHWRLHNAGWMIPPNGTVVFSLNLYYFHHYYVKPVGIKVNNEVLCGLTAPPSFLLHDASDSGGLVTKKRIYVQILVSVILVALSILFSVIIFSFLLLKKMNDTFKDCQHLYTSTEPQQPPALEETYIDVIDDSVATNDTYM